MYTSLTIGPRHSASGPSKIEPKMNQLFIILAIFYNTQNQVNLCVQTKKEIEKLV